MRIVLYGSTKVTELVARALMGAHHHVLGYVPSSREPTVPGALDFLPKLVQGVEGPLTVGDVDLKLSVQYDRWLTPDAQTFNLHTGLLPAWGGCDLLWHTLRQGATEQGLTWHRITDQVDEGPVVATVRYSVVPGDTVLSLYARMLALAPGFAVGCVSLLRGGLDVDACPVWPPVRYLRGQIPVEDRPAYTALRQHLRDRFA